jgi:hypothetical protein
LQILSCNKALKYAYELRWTLQPLLAAPFGAV